MKRRHTEGVQGEEKTHRRSTRRRKDTEKTQEYKINRRHTKHIFSLLGITFQQVNFLDIFKTIHISFILYFYFIISFILFLLRKTYICSTHLPSSYLFSHTHILVRSAITFHPIPPSPHFSSESLRFSLLPVSRRLFVSTGIILIPTNL